jgi:hypothetical protein
MGGISRTGNVTHDNNMIAAEGKRQIAVAQAANQAAATAAEVAYNQTGLASALQTGVNTQPFRTGLRAAGQYA